MPSFVAGYASATRSIGRKEHLVPRVFRPNQPSAWARREFLDRCVADSLTAGAISEVSNRPHCVHPLGVVPPLYETPTILNMRHADAFMANPSFRLDALSYFASIARSDDVMYSLDMAQGYYHANLHPESRTYVGFQWRDKFYVYNVLPFGMATAPRCFAKVMGMLVRHWRARGERIIAYLDD